VSLIEKEKELESKIERTEEKSKELAGKLEEMAKMSQEEAK
jgi:hypothetical protein